MIFKKMFLMAAGLAWLAGEAGAATHSAYGDPICWDQVGSVSCASKIESSVKVLPARSPELTAVPNPAGRDRSIRFQLTGALPAGTRGTFTIYSPAGKAVRSFPLRRLTSGSGLSWDQRDGKRDKLAAGVYLARITASGLLMEKKILILK